MSLMMMITLMITMTMMITPMMTMMMITLMMTMMMVHIILFLIIVLLFHSYIIETTNSSVESTTMPDVDASDIEEGMYNRCMK